MLTKRANGRVWFWGALVIVFGLRLLSLIPPVLDEDEAWFAASAAALRSPFEYFQVAPDNKPPGTVWLYWVWSRLSGQYPDPAWVRGLGFIPLLLTAGVLALIVRRVGSTNRRPDSIGRYHDSDGRPELAAALFLIASSCLGPKVLAMTNEQLMLPGIVISYAVFLGSAGITGRPLLVRGLLSGGLLGASIIFKQNAVLFLLPLLIQPLYFATALMGCVAVIVAFALGLGPGEFWHWVVAYPRDVLTAARGRLFSISDALTSLFTFFLLLWPLFRVQKVVPTFLWLWIGAATLAIFSGGGLFLHYFILALPPLITLACGKKGVLFTPLRVVWLLAALGLSTGASAFPELGVLWGTDLSYYSEIAERVRSWTTPEDRIWVWGNTALPHALSERRYPTAFMNARFVSGPYAETVNQKGFEKNFAANPPALVIDLHRRGDNRFDHPLERYPALETFIKDAYEYRRDPALPWVNFYFRKGHPLPAGTIPESAPDTAAMHTDDEIWKLSQSVLWDFLRGVITVRQVRRIEELLRTRAALSGLPTPNRDSAPLAEADLRELSRYFRTNQYRQPFALKSQMFWVSFSMVKLQPVAEGIGKRRGSHDGE